MTDFSDQFRKIVMRYKRISYNLNDLFVDREDSLTS